MWRRSFVDVCFFPSESWTDLCWMSWSYSGFLPVEAHWCTSVDLDFSAGFLRILEELQLLLFTASSQQLQLCSSSRSGTDGSLVCTVLCVEVTVSASQKSGLWSSAPVFAETVVVCRSDGGNREWKQKKKFSKFSSENDGRMKLHETSKHLNKFSQNNLKLW